MNGEREVQGGMGKERGVGWSGERGVGWNGE